VRQDQTDGTWWAGLERYTQPPSVDDIGTALWQPAGGASRREALEQLWLSIDLEDDFRR